ncbi:MAG: spermidine synthase [Candidatus Eisenbacteria bacterium]|uniref:Spermidine synthase n=1 Tax=Eiseniibacteriota bacterium TaxID=2212470 RepID=A0A937X7G6_UNCEI|nr:spermidine synthase [Candidatus Eisenbacteria bacterium]
MDVGDPGSVLRAETPHGRLVLHLRGGARPGATLILGGTILMDSDVAASEELLARESLAARRGPRAARRVRALVAGLGLGITLRELLRERRVASVLVVELFAALVDWNRGPLAALNGGALADQRVTCRVGDVRGLLESPPGEEQAPFDLLLFDIDNGPTWLSVPANAWLYSAAGLRRVAAWSAPGGVAAFWATEPSAGFEGELARLGLPWRSERVDWVEPASGRLLDYYLYLVGAGPEAGR